MWADDSGDEGPSQRKGFGQSSGGGGRKNYSAPVSFVAGGVQQAGKDKDKIAMNNEEEEDNENNEDCRHGGSSSSDSR